MNNSLFEFKYNHVIMHADEGLTLETSAFPNSLWRLIHLYQLRVDNLELLLVFYLPADAAQQFH